MSVDQLITEASQKSSLLTTGGRSHVCESGGVEEKGWNQLNLKASVATGRITSSSTYLKCNE